MNRIAGLFAWMSLLAASGNATAQPSPTASPAPAAEFLSLPALELERVGEAAGKPRVGDALQFRAQAPEGAAKLAVPEGVDSLAEQGWDVRVQDSAAGAAGGLLLRATPLKAGRVSLPTLVIQDGDGKAIARTHPVDLEVESVIKPDDADPSKPADLRPPVSLRFPWWVVVVAVLALALLVVALVYVYLRRPARKPRPKPVAPAEPPRPEDEVALAAFAQLEAGGPLSRGDYKAHYFRVSEILKAYIGARYRFDAAESTTRELIAHLDERRILSDQQIDRLESLFEKLDLVKFTDHVPVPDEGMRLLGIAKELVLTTRRPPPVVAQAPRPGDPAGRETRR